MCGNQNDPFITYLKSFGYNPIRLPRADVHPLQLMVKSGKDLVFLGDITDVFTSTTKPPSIDANNVASSISGQRSGQLSIGLALSLLGNIIGALGGTKLGLDVAYKNVRNATFEFPEVLEDHVSVAKLDQFLSTADVNPNGTSVAKMLEADEVYITTNTIKSKKFTVDASMKSDVTTGIDIPVVSQIVGASVKVSVDSSSAAKVTYSGDTPITFGFQAVQLFFENGAYTAIKPAQGVSLRRMESKVPNDGGVRLESSGAFAALTF